MNHLPLLLLLFSAAASASAAADSSSAYDVLRSHGLPMGLLPKGVVKAFTFDDSTGAFEVHLDRACNARFESEVHYDVNVSGTLGYGQIGSLSGISAKDLFLWFPVKGIRVDIPSSGLIYFDVGVVYKQFSLSLFETPPECTDPPSSDSVHLAEGRDLSFKSELGSLRIENLKRATM